LLLEIGDRWQDRKLRDLDPDPYFVSPRGSL
jgi:hypothetical protein